MPRTWSAASETRRSPDAQIGFDESTPPDMLTGNDPSRAVSPRSTIFHPSVGAAMSWASSHIGSYQLNGTYNSAQSIWPRGSVMPACAYTSAAQSTAPWGRTGSRPGNDDGSERTADPRIHAG